MIKRLGTFEEQFISNLKTQRRVSLQCGGRNRVLTRISLPGDQILQIIPTRDDFEQIIGDIVFANFKMDDFRVIAAEELLEEQAGLRVMQLRIRPEVFMCVIENKLPWEDFSLGFQMRVKRSPNVYESDFWYYFTNEYIGQGHIRYSSFCGACTVVEHNPIWIN